MDNYSIFNPVVWGIFIGMTLIIFIAIKWFHARYPNFSEVDITRDTLQVADIMFTGAEFSDPTKVIVNVNDSIDTLYFLFLKYDEDYFYVRNQEGLIGTVFLDDVLGIDGKRENIEVKGAQMNEYPTGI